MSANPILLPHQGKDIQNETPESYKSVLIQITARLESLPGMEGH